jgi:hypothetical protein
MGELLLIELDYIVLCWSQGNESGRGVYPIYQFAEMMEPRYRKPLITSAPEKTGARSSCLEEMKRDKRYPWTCQRMRIWYKG